jgi:hypothetical protein
VRREKVFLKIISKTVAGLKIVCNFAAPNDKKHICAGCRGKINRREFFELLKSYKNNKQHNFVLCE